MKPKLKVHSTNGIVAEIDPHSGRRRFATLMMFARTDRAVRAPVKAHDTDTGFDVSAAKTMWLPPFFPRKVPTGIRLSVPWEHGVELRPRSSMSARGILCAIGTIDEGYRGEVKAVLVNLCPWRWWCRVKAGERIGQLVLERRERVSLKEVSAGEFDRMDETERGNGGFGSTGR